MPLPTDEQLTDAWEECALGRAISHEEHLRISFVLLRRHGSEEGVRRIVVATRRNCEALGAAERYDEALTRRWAEALAQALESSNAASADELLAEHPDFRRSDLFGRPAWRTEPRG